MDLNIPLRDALSQDLDTKERRLLCTDLETPPAAKRQRAIAKFW